MKKTLTHKQISILGAKNSWKSRTKGKSKAQIREMMQKMRMGKSLQ